MKSMCSIKAMKGRGTSIYACHKADMVRAAPSRIRSFQSACTRVRETAKTVAQGMNVLFACVCPFESRMSRSTM